MLKLCISVTNICQYFTKVNFEIVWLLLLETNYLAKKSSLLLHNFLFAFSQLFTSMLGLILMKQSYHLVTLLSIHFHSFINNIFSVCHSVLLHTTTLSHSSTLLPIQHLLTLFYTFTPRLWVCLSLFGLRLSVCRLKGVCISVFVNPFRPCVCLCVCARHVIRVIQSHKVTSGLNGYKATFSLKVREGER